MNIWVQAALEPIVMTTIAAGLVSVVIGMLIASVVGRLRHTANAWIGYLIATGAGCLGVGLSGWLASAVCGSHVERFPGLAFAAGCYWPVSDAGRHASLLRWALLASLWLVMVSRAAEDVSLSGGLAQSTFADLTLVGAVFAPIALALAFAKRS